VIYLITGQIGAGKTLYALPFVKKLAEEETPPRQVYYCGINGINREILPWIDLGYGVDLNPEVEAEEDRKSAAEAAEKHQEYVPWFRNGEYPTSAKGARDWWKLPVGSIIVIDECQEPFPPRGAGSVQPKHIELMARSRHRGYDVVLLTQGPSMFDSFIRSLINRHYHVIRNFGLKKATIHEWHRLCLNPNSKAEKAAGTRHEFFYPKEVFKWYESSKKHTHKSAVPLRVFLLPVIVIVALVAAFVAYRLLLSSMHPKTPDGQPVASSSAPGGVVGASPGGVHQVTAVEYAQSYTPRVPGYAYTAPRYDQITRPTEAPYPAACVSIRGECRCYSQQGTRLTVVASDCMRIVRDGFFMDWKRQDNKTDQARPATSEASNAG
jgi:zona occludens toxin